MSSRLGFLGYARHGRYTGEGELDITLSALQMVGQSHSIVISETVHVDLATIALSTAVITLTESPNVDLFGFALSANNVDNIVTLPASTVQLVGKDVTLEETVHISTAVIALVGQETSPTEAVHVDTATIALSTAAITLVEDTNVDVAGITLVAHDVDNIVTLSSGTLGLTSYAVSLEENVSVDLASVVLVGKDITIVLDSYLTMTGVSATSSAGSLTTWTDLATADTNIWTEVPAA